MGVTAFCVIACALLFNQLITHFTVILDKIGEINRILSPFIWGLVIAYLLTPLLNIYERQLFIPLCKTIYKNKEDTEEKKVKIAKTARKFAVALSILTLVIFVMILVLMIFPRLYQSLEKIIISSSDFVIKAYDWLDKALVDYPKIESMISSSFGSLSDGIINFLTTTLMPQMNNIITSAASGVAIVVKGVYNIIVGIIVSVYVMSNKEKAAASCKKVMYSTVSVEQAKHLMKSVHFLDKVFLSFLSGKILDSIIIGILCYIGCLILRMPYALLVSTFIGITNIIPFFGPLIGAIPSALVIFMESPVKCLVFLIFVFVLQQFDGNFLGPKILGSTVGINGFWIMFAIIVGSGLFGFGGMLLGVPVFVIIYTLISSRIDTVLERRGLSTDLNFYSNISYIDSETGNAVPADNRHRGNRSLRKTFEAVWKGIVFLYRKIRDLVLLVSGKIKELISGKDKK